MMNIFKRYDTKWTMIILIVALAIYLFGCAALEGMLTEVQEITTTGEANPEIHTTFSYIDDFVNKPWDGIAAVGIGYALALLRRWYKKKQGSKST